MDKRPLIQQVVIGMRFGNPSDYWMSNHAPSDFPELEVAKDIKHSNGQSVWEHTMLVIDSLSDATSIALLSGLFHDLGKSCIKPTTNPQSRFPNHDIESAKIAVRRLGEWGASSYVTDRVVRLVSTHMYDITGATKEKTIRKFIADVGRDNIQNWFKLRIADSMAYSRYGEYYSRTIDPFRSAVTSYLKKQPSSSQQAIIGSDSDRTLRINGGDA
jgi:hypothetical protein